jgi:DNA repair exonuclease SbcCD ATPase subunit
MPRTKTKQTNEAVELSAMDKAIERAKEYEESQLGLFDYSNYSEDFKLKSYERKARIKANEQVATKAFYDIAQDVKAQHDDMGDYKEWLEWCKTELDYRENMACSFLKIGTEITAELRSKNLPTSHSALDRLARALSNANDETKQEILTAVELKTEEKGKALTEKEIKEITSPYLEQINQLTEQLNEAKQGELFFQQTLDKKQKDYTDLLETYTDKVNHIQTLEETVNNQNKQIKELNTAISAKESQLESLENDKLELDLKQRELDDLIAKEANVIAQQTLEQERQVLLKKEADLLKKEGQIKDELKDVQNLKKTAQRQKDNLDSTQEWITNFQLTNEFLAEATNELKKYKNNLQKNPNLSELEENDRATVEEKIKNLIVDFNDNLHSLGGAINYLNGAVVKFNNIALRVLDAEVVSND